MTTNTAYHYIGLDIHKRSIRFCEKLADGTEVDSGSFAARRTDIQRWAATRKAPWVGGMEATLFTGFVYDLLQPYAMALHVGHPLHLKAISWAKHKSDHVDTATLTDLLRANLFPSCYVAPPELRELRQALRYRNFMVEQAVRMKNKTAGLLMASGVEYDGRRLHGKRYFNELLASLEEVPPSVIDLLRTTRQGLEMFESAQQQLLSGLKRHPRLQRRLEQLQTIDSVGDITGLTWILEIADPSRFANIKHVQSYCGLCSGRHESGGKDRRAPLSKQRNPRLQTILIETAKLAPRYNGQLAALHDRALNELGYNRNRATLAVARKLVCYLWAVDKSGKNFVPSTGTV